MARMFPKIPRILTILLVLLTALAVSASGRLLFAATAPLSSPVAPTQPSGVTPLQFEQTASQNVEIKEATGDVTVKKSGNGQFATVQPGSLLHAGDSIRTVDGTCHLVIDGKSDVYLRPRTLMKVVEASRDEQSQTQSTHLEMENGGLKVMLSKLKKGSTFQVDTPTAIASVRGTIFYLNSGIFQGKNATQLYVDETQKGVFFKNIFTGESFTVGAFSMSNAFADGKLSPPQPLSPEQRDTYTKNWQNPGTGASQQFGIEEIPIPPSGNTGNAGGGTDNLPNGNKDNLSTNDAARDKVADQNIPGANGLPPPPTFVAAGSIFGPSLINPSPSPSPSDRGNGSDTSSGGSSSGEPAPEPSPSSSPASSDSPTDIAEKTMIREEIARIRGDQDFDHADANLARISDAQTGKVFTDVFGNRVRTDQYIFHEDGSDTVQFLSLTARTGEYQNGVSALLFGTQFNHGFSSSVDLKSLPWNDYMNVVKKEDVAQNLGIAQGTPEYSALYNEYIVHEHKPELAQGDSAFYPMHFFAQFMDPVRDQSVNVVRFDDFFSSPFSMNLQTSNGLKSFTVQGKILDWMLVVPSNGESVLLANSYLTGQTITIGQGDPQPLIDENHHNDSGSQTASFAANFDNSKLLDVNYYRNLPVNNDGNPNNDEHPAYFDNRFNDRLDANSAVIGNNQLIGAFIPINDQGKIIDQPGFRVRGVRDLMSPNPQVNGGVYNLEVLLLYGYVDTNDLFHEDFRIDTIITPEIFTQYPNQITNTSSLFPPALRADDDDTSQG